MAQQGSGMTEAEEVAATMMADGRRMTMIDEAHVIADVSLALPIETVGYEVQQQVLDACCAIWRAARGRDR